MRKSLYNKFQLSIAQSVNRFIYSIINFKPLRGQISEEWYARRDIKRFLTVLAILKAVFWELFVRGAYFILVICLPNLALEGVFEWEPDIFWKVVIWSFFFMNCMIGSFGNSHILGGCDENQYILLNLMRIDPREHFLTELIWEYGKQIVLYFLVFMVLMSRHGLTGTALWLIACYICFRPLGEAVSLKFCEKLGMPWRDKSKAANRCFFIYGACMMFLAYGTYPILTVWQGGGKQPYNPVFDAVFSPVILGVVFVAALAAGLWAVLYLKKYPHYSLVVHRVYSLEKLRKGELQAQELVKKGYDLDADEAEKELEEHVESRRLFLDKSGYEYLHALFFHRHKKQMHDVVIVRRAVVAGIFGIAAVTLVVFHILMLLGRISPASYEKAVSQEVAGSIGNFFGLVVFCMYCASSGSQLTGAMFYNCDISLMKYGFYRKKEAIMESFWIRLRYMVKAELPLMGIFCAGILGDALLLHLFDQIPVMILFAICACVLSVFFSVVHLCMYYIFQPYTEGGTETGFAYKFCNMVLWIFSYGCLQLRLAPIHFMGMVLIVTVVTLAVGVMFVNWRAPKNFRLK